MRIYYTNRIDIYWNDIWRRLISDPISEEIKNKEGNTITTNY